MLDLSDLAEKLAALKDKIDAFQIDAPGNGEGILAPGDAIILSLKAQIAQLERALSINDANDGHPHRH